VREVAGEERAKVAGYLAKYAIKHTECVGGLGRVSRIIWGPGEQNGKEDPAAVVGGGLVIASGDATPLLELVPVALDDVALPVAVTIEPARPTATTTTTRTVSLLVAAFGDVWAILRRRSNTRLALELYALSATIRSGRVRGRPTPVRGTPMPASTTANCVVSWTWPAVTWIASDRQRPSAAPWILVVNPPRDRPNA
jgi:hypothetical protein